MNITQTEGTVTITSQEIASYGYIHIIQDVTITDTIVVSDIFTDISSTYTFLSDGYFIITEIRLPLASGSGYYIDMDEEIIYAPDDTVITTEELLALDTTGTNIIREDEDWLTMYILNEYYINLLKSKYLKNICNCGCGCIEKSDKVKLDTLTMGLDLIEALEAKYQYYEIQRIVEKLMVCFNLADSNCDC
jgi:hypothetical protein